MPGTDHIEISEMLGKLGEKLGYAVFLAHRPDWDSESLVSFPAIIPNPASFEKARNIDVIWFNDDGFPEYAFEIGISSNIESGIKRLLQLKDFRCRMFIIVLDEDSFESSTRKFTNILALPQYQSINDGRIQLRTNKQVGVFYTTVDSFVKKRQHFLGQKEKFPACPEDLQHGIPESFCPNSPLSHTKHNP